MKKYTKIICMAAAVCLLGAAAFCGFRIYSHYAHESEQEEVFEKIAEVMWRTTHIGQRQTRKPKRKTNLDKSKVVECCLSIGSKEFVNFLFSS